MMFKSSNNTEKIVAQARVALLGRERIRQAINQTAQALPQAKAAVTAARAALASEEVGLVLDPAGPAESTKAYADLRAAEENLTRLHARGEGLERKLVDDEDNLMLVEAEFRAAREELTQALLRDYREAYASAAEAFAKQIRIGLALGDALGTPMNGLRSIELREPTDSSQNIVELRILTPECGWQPSWHGDAKAEALHREISPIVETARRLEAEMAVIGGRRKMAADEEAKARHENRRKTSALTHAAIEPEPSPFPAIREAGTGRPMSGKIY